MRRNAYIMLLIGIIFIISGLTVSFLTYKKNVNRNIKNKNNHLEINITDFTLEKSDVGVDLIGLVTTNKNVKEYSYYNIDFYDNDKIVYSFTFALKSNYKDKKVIIAYNVNDDIKKYLNSYKIRKSSDIEEKMYRGIN